ncbi:transglutaminase-like domain-containing protein [Chitinophaga sp. 212800010-3]|uniref:transglutaminase-like domain-containing protein n=1 Tax=unclassified Chitinophaga TaxID=2619133 RepID=UPI002DEB6353|nr:Transglutaminase domain-containing protein [Chitinophaga sp. 212800010-3]
MKNAFKLAVALVGLSASAFSQTQLPLIKAASSLVSIRDDGHYNRNVWTIVPATRPDVYVTSGRKITFYTDQDSITFHTKRNQEYNFCILLNGRDSAFTQIRCVVPYLEKLRNGKKYSYEDKQGLPAFSYQPADDEHLKKLRQTLKLDSIAGTGNDASKVINLMYWVHQVIRHDGGSDNPKLLNAPDIISICQREQRGVNCRMMATVLNECYLAMGYKSRFVTCMPRELKFEDCHVIDMVYLPEQEKWVWMDPTFGAYVMDEKGELLGLKEVRERLISGQPLLLNPDANWNRKNSQTVEGYLNNYMAKNLYRLRCAVFSQYDTETYAAGKQLEYIELVPLDALNQKGWEEKHKDMKSTYYLTNNPNLFWTRP